MKISVGSWRGGVQGAWLAEYDSTPHVGSHKAGANPLGVTSSKVSVLVATCQSHQVRMYHIAQGTDS